MISSSRPPSATPNMERAVSVNNAVRTIFSALLDGAGAGAGSVPFANSEIGDVPREILSLLQNGDTARTLRIESEREGRGVAGDKIAEKEAVLSLDFNNLIIGSIISVGRESQQSNGSDICAFKYSSLLRLALFLSAVPAGQLEILLPRLLRISEEWPKIILKAFSHLLSSSRATQDFSTSISAPDPALVQIVVQVRSLPPIPIATFHLSLLTATIFSY